MDAQERRPRLHQGASPTAIAGPRREVGAASMTPEQFLRPPAWPTGGITRATIVAAALLGIDAAGPRAQEASWLEQENATGGWGGARQRIVDAGITPSASYTTDLLANPIGRARQASPTRAISNPRSSSIWRDCPASREWRR